MSFDLCTNTGRLGHKLTPASQEIPPRQMRSPSRDTVTTAATMTTTTTEATMMTTTTEATTAAEKLLPQAKVPNDEQASSIVPEIMFTTPNALFERLRDVSRDHYTDSLVVGQVSAETYRMLKAERDRRDSHYRFFFLPKFACLIVTIPSQPHEFAHLYLYDTVVDALRSMGIGKRDWSPIGTADMDALDGASGSGQGDGGGGPTSRRQVGEVFWPTLVIEAGASQTLPSLRMKARWWFAASNFRMKVVVLVKLIVATLTIQVEQWVAEVPGPPRHGATTTRASRAAKQSVLRQQLSIAYAGASPLLQTPIARRAESDFRVVGAPLVLRFEDLMERPPVPAAGEHDITLSEGDLQTVALCVWSVA